MTGNLLTALLLAGVLGMVGQGVRVIAGLKKMGGQQDATSEDLFVAARLVVSFMIGFVAGVVAALSLDLQSLITIVGSDGKLVSGGVQLLLGIMAAGYAGTDFIESFLPTITKAVPPKPSGGGKPSETPQEPKTAASAGNAAQAKAEPVPTPDAAAKAATPQFCALVPGGFFSNDPDDFKVKRSIRTNNPGALNFSAWQKTRPGYVGFTQRDESPSHNLTTIYRTPEHGVAAWYHLLAVKYGFPNGVFTLNDLAVRYAGSAANPRAIANYVTGWSRWLEPPLSTTAQIAVTNQTAMLGLGKAMFSHEAGEPTPVHDDQIAYGIARESAGTLPN